MNILTTATALIAAGEAARPGPWDTKGGDVYSPSFRLFNNLYCHGTAYDADFIAISRSAPEVARALIQAVQLIEELNAHIDWNGIDALTLAEKSRAFLAGMEGKS